MYVAHLNPIITYAFLLRGHFHPYLVPFYLTAQLMGSVFGAAMLRGFFGIDEALKGSNAPMNGHSLWAVMMFEAVVSCGFILVALNAAAGKRLGRHAALAGMYICMYVCLCTCILR